MDILMYGRWVLLVMGSLALLDAILLTAFRPEPFRRLLLAWIFGVLITGLGVFGLEFMPKYREWLDSVADIIKIPSKESYETFFTKVGNEEIPTEIQELGINYAINNPVEGMESILTNAIARAPEGTNGKKALEWARKSFQGKQHAIDQLLKSNPSVDSAKQFDPVTSNMFYLRLKELPQTEIQSFGIDPNKIPQYKPKPKPFPKKE